MLRSMGLTCSWFYPIHINQTLREMYLVRQPQIYGWSDKPWHQWWPCRIPAWVMRQLMARKPGLSRSKPALIHQYLWQHYTKVGVILTLKQLGFFILYFISKIIFHFVMLFIINVIFIYELGQMQFIIDQHWGYWWLGALAPGHQYPQCWVCTSLQMFMG